MNPRIIAAAIAALTGAVTPVSFAQFDLGRAIQAGVGALQAATLSDAQVEEYVHQAVEQMDAANTVTQASDPYSQRLMRLTQGIEEVDGTPLNFKVYRTDEINAFACADGSVRVYTGIMDVMTDDELLGVIGHEIGHVGLRHSRNAMKQQILNDALLEGIASTSTAAAVLTSTQLTQIGKALMSARYSRKQESQADDYGYEFLRQHGRNPWAMAHAFEKLQQQELQSGGGATGMALMFSDHPDTQSRIEHIRERCIKDRIADSASGTSAASAATPSYASPSASSYPSAAEGTKKGVPQGAVTSSEWTF